MAIAFVNSGAIFNAPQGTTTDFTLGWVPVTGNFLAVVAYHIGNTAMSCADDRGTGNVYTQDATVANGTNLRFSIFSCPNYQGSGGVAPKITITNNANVFTSIAVGEYSGIATSSPVDVAATTGTGSASNPTQSAGLTTLNADDLLIAGFGDITGGNNTITGAASYNLRQSNGDGTANFVGAYEDRIVAATGTYTGSFTYTPTQQWATAQASYKAFVAAPSNTPPIDDGYIPPCGGGWDQTVTVW